MSEEDVSVFLHMVERTQLDPLARQIYAVRRWDKRRQRDVWTIQTGIDGYRLIADRTGRYAPGREPEFRYSADGSPLSATAHVRKMTPDGTWHDVSATAFMAEYMPTEGTGASGMWQRMPHVMLAKCAEALALRRAFPAELSGLYTAEEMDQADNGAPPAETQQSETAAPPQSGTLRPPQRKPKAEAPQAQPAASAPPQQQGPPPAPEPDKKYISEAQRRRLYALTKQHNLSPEEVRAKLRDVWGVDDSRHITREQYDEICAWVTTGLMPPESPADQDDEVAF